MGKSNPFDLKKGKAFCGVESGKKEEKDKKEVDGKLRIVKEE